MSAANFTSPGPGLIWVGRQPSASSRTQELLLMASGGNQAVFSLLPPLAVPLLLKPRCELYRLRSNIAGIKAGKFDRQGKVRLQQSNTDQQMSLRNLWSSRTSSRIASGS